MGKYLTFVFLAFDSFLIQCQNLFIDPAFDEPKAPIIKAGEPCINPGIVSEAYSNLYFAVGTGTPDIVVPADLDCMRYIDNALITSQCLRLVFSNDPISTTFGVYKEPVFTKLKENIKIGKNYILSFDILCNPSSIHTENNCVLHEPLYFNVVLVNSKSSLKDTLNIPVSKKSFAGWERVSLVFESKSEFDIVQFDFFEKEFFGSDKKVCLFTYLDNFSLVHSEDNSVTITENNRQKGLLKNKKKLTYYFNSNSHILTKHERDKLLNQIRPLIFQDIKRVNISAFTDNTSTVQYNDTLSKRRAEYILNIVKEFFKNNTIEYTSIGKGIDTQNPYDKARRVDIVVEYNVREIAPWYKTSNNYQSTFNFLNLGNIELGKRRDRVSESKKIRKDEATIFDTVPFDAEKMILTEAKNIKILIINESHTFPDHRIFISKLLPKLKELGYSKLAVEALQENNDPHSLTFKDPVFFRYLLDAKDMGYDLLSYDVKSSVEPDWESIRKLDNVEYTAAGLENISKDMNIRDYNEFLNLERDIDSLADDEKMIIHVGHGHGGKRQKDDWKPLGSYLSDKYGSDMILSIDQVTLNNCVNQDSNDYYNLYKPNKSIVCSSGGIPYFEKEFSPLSFTYEKFTDLQVLHVGTDINLNIDTSYIYVNHNEIEKPDYPLAIIVYESDADPRTDVAYSAVEVKDEDEFKPSIIPNQGGYKVLIKDSQNQIVSYDSYGQ